jgi:hypothetical protein
VAAEDLQDTVDYSSDDSSSSGSIPNIRPLNSFTSYNSSVRLGKSLRPVPPSSSSDEHYSDAEIEIVGSDLHLPRPVSQQVAEETETARTTLAPSRPSPIGQSSGTMPGKRTISAHHRERMSQGMKGE